MTGRFNLKEIYPKSPLVEVVCEMRFQPRLEIEAGRAAFWDKIRSKYPKLGVPAGTPTCPPCAQPCRFEREDESAGVLLGISQCAYYQKRYQGHEAFIGEFLRNAKAVVKQFKVSSFDRLGWRYINLIPIVRKQDGSVPLGDFILSPVKLPRALAGPIHHESLSLRIPFAEGMQTWKVEVVNSPEGHEALLLDIDVAINGTKKASVLLDAVQKAHERARETFEALIQPRYRIYLKGA